jgi:hypothetical protein
VDPLGGPLGRWSPSGDPLVGGAPAAFWGGRLVPVGFTARRLDSRGWRLAGWPRPRPGLAGARPHQPDNLLCPLCPSCRMTAFVKKADRRYQPDYLPKNAPAVVSRGAPARPPAEASPDPCPPGSAASSRALRMSSDGRVSVLGGQSRMAPGTCPWWLLARAPGPEA